MDIETKLFSSLQEINYDFLNPSYQDHKMYIPMSISFHTNKIHSHLKFFLLHKELYHYQGDFPIYAQKTHYQEQA
ncbi:hypothetical protein CXU21_01265 [Akkermansia muciniphila]|nr:hypothetical protein CXU21_01265 [Akkermansia muciniphila]